MPMLFPQFVLYPTPTRFHYRRHFISASMKNHLACVVVCCLTLFTRIWAPWEKNFVSLSLCCIPEPRPTPVHGQCSINMFNGWVEKRINGFIIHFSLESLPWVLISPTRNAKFFKVKWWMNLRFLMKISSCTQFNYWIVWSWNSQGQFIPIIFSCTSYIINFVLKNCME